MKRTDSYQTGWATGCVALCAVAASLGLMSAERAHTTTAPVTPVDETLVRKLLEGESTESGAMEQTLEFMDLAAGRLTEELDPGRKTQALQDEVIRNLDRLIENASRNRTSKQGSRKRNRSTERRGSPGKARGEKSRKPGAVAGQGGSGNTGGKQRTSDADEQNKADLARQWGFLPELDRLEISRGYEEEFMPRYRRQIERYYRNLARDKPWVER